MFQTLPTHSERDRARTKGVALAVLASMCFATWGVGLLHALWGNYEPAEGVLTLNGQPLSGANITLHPLDATAGIHFTPTAQSAADGVFRLRTTQACNGVPAGKYAITVRLTRQTIHGESLADGPNLLPEEYASAKSTPLTIEIVPGLNRFKIELTSSHSARILAATGPLDPQISKL